MQGPSDSFTIKSIFSRERSSSLLSALALLAVAYIVEYSASVYASNYSQRPTYNYVGDLILDVIPVVDLSFIIIEVGLAAIVLGTWFVFSRPRYILFTLKTVALFVIIRAFFISLTHIGIHPDGITPGLGFFDAVYSYLKLQTGLFFSGHTGLPILMGLIFWHKPSIRYAFFSLAFVFAVSVLLAHVHYSIDVFAAPFMAYGIFKISQRLFSRDYELIGK